MSYINLLQLHKQMRYAVNEWRTECNAVFPPGAWFLVKAFKNQKTWTPMQVEQPCYHGLFKIRFRQPKRSGRGYVRRSVPIEAIGERVPDGVIGGAR